MLFFRPKTPATTVAVTNWNLAHGVLIGPPLAATLVLLIFVTLVNPGEAFLLFFWMGATVVSYGGVLLIGLPAALWLRRQNRLSGLNLFFIAWVVSAAIGLVALAHGNGEMFITCLLAGASNATTFWGVTRTSAKWRT